MTRPAPALVVVADDFGASPGANAGIVMAHQRGIVTAAALMVGLPDTEEAASLARDTGLAAHRALRVGLHLRLSAGPALTQDVVRAGLATGDGFRSLPAVLGRLFHVRRPVRDAIRAEVRAQMEALLVLGIPSGPDHVNTHHHLHLHPAVLDVVLKEAVAYGFPAVRWPVEPWWGLGSLARAPEVWVLRLLAMWGRSRLARSGLRSSDHFRGLRLMGRHLTPETLIATLRALPPGTTELMCHPGQPDEGLARFTSYTQDRTVELATLTDSRVRRVIEEEGIVLTTYSELTNGRMMSNFFEQVYEIVRQVPEGKVVSYGQVAAMLGAPHAARTVGWALHALPADSDVPWHRVINARGRVSTSCLEHDASVQQQFLEAEGVVFDVRGYVDLQRFRWAGLTPWEVDEILERAGLAE